MGSPRGVKLIVDDLAATEKFRVEPGAVITKPNEATVTGRNLFARYPDGSVLEYIEWKPDGCASSAERVARNQCN
jgi:hypothetical protein